MRLGGRRRLVPRLDLSRRHPLAPSGATGTSMQVKTVQHGLGERGPRSAVTGELVCGPRDVHRRGALPRTGPTSARSSAPTRWTTTYHRRAIAGLDEDHGAAPLGRRTGAATGCTCAGTSRASSGSPRRRSGSRCTASSTGPQFYTDYGRELQKRFFDHFLKGEENGWDREPRVQLNVRHVDGRVRARHEDEWPIPRTEWTKLHLDPAAMSLAAEPVAEAGTVTFDALGEGVTFTHRPRRRRPS